jgi:hypothetical protein
MVQQDFNNVYENAVLYDSFLAGGIIPTLYPNAQWFSTFAAIAAQNEIPFFNLRNESMVGPQYCNMDSIDKMTFVFLCRSIGVQFFAMPTVGKQTLDAHNASDEQAEAAGLLLWCQEIAKHSSIILKINQDEKIVLNATMCPSGYGVAGDADARPGLVFSSVFTNWGNGKKELKNRWKFPVPVEIPRNQTISVKLEISAIGKEILRAMKGPSLMALNDDELGEFATPPTTPNLIPAVVGVRVSLEGLRAVQQRGALHV